MHSCTHTWTHTPYMLSSPSGSPRRGDSTAARPRASFIYEGVTKTNTDAHSSVIGAALSWLSCLILTHRVGSQKARGRDGGKREIRERWDKGGGWDGPKKDKTNLDSNGMRKNRVTESQSCKIKGWRMEEGDRGVIDMTGRVRRGDKRCGSSILGLSSAWRGFCSM